MNPDAPVTKHRMAGLLIVPALNSNQFPGNVAAEVMRRIRHAYFLRLLHVADRRSARELTRFPGTGATDTAKPAARMAALRGHPLDLSAPCAIMPPVSCRPNDRKK